MVPVVKLSAMTSGLVRAVVAEFIATLLFVFFGAGTVVVTGIVGGSELTDSRIIAIALAHGLAIAMLVAMTINVSGAHINPVVTVVGVIMGKIGLSDGILYIVAQLGGAVMGAFLVMVVVPGDGGTLGAHSLAPGVGLVAGVVVEITLTFALVLVVLFTTMGPRIPNSLAPMSIGFIVLVGVLVGTPLTGGSMNPARTLGPALIANDWVDHWIYWLGPVTGGLLATFTWKWIYSSRRT